MGMPMQNDTEPKTDTVEDTENVVDDSEKTIDEINEEIEAELEEAAVELDPQQQMEADLLKWKETAMRTAADLENFRKRSTRERAEAIKFGNQRLIEELLPVIDNFTMGMMAAEQDSASMIYMGMKMVQAQLEGFLESQGVKEAVTEIGAEFDPNIHDAMSQEESDEFEEGKIIRVMRKGYLLGDRLIRPANVVVSKKAEEAPEAIEVETAE